ncbi:hypothetical protein EYF80_053904 [Liparis tanakae]|uniref:Uncharacterized protein n=1 Tax=Liparis tanakae TaxID=230148 RepID=A0A4Z2F5A9_9TELE|nr:hypothetical protein EYF80_053904 [Liparis tanakae]
MLPDMGGTIHTQSPGQPPRTRYSFSMCFMKDSVAEWWSTMLKRIAMLISTSAWSFQSEEVFLVSKAIRKSLTPISVPMYQPLKGQQVNSRPPISSSMLETAGRLYHFSSRSLNHSYLERNKQGE